jgi:hypothetical protein
LLPIWYANLEHEVRFLIPRMQLMPWKAVSAALLFTVYLGPLILLLLARLKRAPWYLGAASALLLIFLWIERWWLITPVFEPGELQLGMVELSAAVALLGVFAYGIAVVQRPVSAAGVGRGREP